MPSPHAPHATAAAHEAAPRPPESFAAAARPGDSQLTPPRRWNSQTLFGLDREVEIEHAGQLYRLRQTSLGKLILTK